MALQRHKGYPGGRGDDPHGVSRQKTGTYVGTMGNRHFFTAEGTGGGSTDSVTFDDPSKNELEWRSRFQEGKKYNYTANSKNLPTPYDE